ncbi:MAG: hypothetical protein IJ044_04010 [Oscillospiraceae bacterium]|nr:hypothetical protein [Oscillospiraceae bacterium]
MPPAFGLGGRADNAAGLSRAGTDDQQIARADGGGDTFAHHIAVQVHVHHAHTKALHQVACAACPGNINSSGFQNGVAEGFFLLPVDAGKHFGNFGHGLGGNFLGGHIKIPPVGGDCSTLQYSTKSAPRQQFCPPYLVATPAYFYLD